MSCIIRERKGINGAGVSEAWVVQKIGLLNLEKIKQDRQYVIVGQIFDQSIRNPQMQGSDCSSYRDDCRR